MRIRADSTEYVSGTITTDHDPAGSGVEVAIYPRDQHPTVLDPYVFTQADVTGTTDNGDGTWTVAYRLLVAAESLTGGDYSWIVRFTDNPEVIVRQTGLLTVTAH